MLRQQRAHRAPAALYCSASAGWASTTRRRTRDSASRGSSGGRGADGSAPSTALRQPARA